MNFRRIGSVATVLTIGLLLAGLSQSATAALILDVKLVWDGTEYANSESSPFQFTDDSGANPLHVNDELTFRVYARITDGGDGNLTNDYMTAVMYNVIASNTSSGTWAIKGNMTSPSIADATAWNGLCQAPAVADLNADLLTDIGSANNSSQTGWGISKMATGEKLYPADGAVLCVEFTYTVTALSSDGTAMVLTPNIRNNTAGANFMQDGVVPLYNGTKRTYMEFNEFAMTYTEGGGPVVTPEIVSVAADGTGVATLFGPDAVLDVDGSGGTFAGWGAQVSGHTGTGGNPSVGFAKFLAGEQSVAGNVTMSWRARLVGEVDATGHPLVSDAMKLEGMTAGDVYVLQMEYDELDDAILGNEAHLIANGLIYLVTRADSTSPWLAAVNAGMYQGELAFSAYTGPLTVGVWGIDTTDPDRHYVWAVLNHSSEFAVVPEPATMAFLLLGGMAMAGAGVVQRRRRGGK